MFNNLHNDDRIKSTWIFVIDSIKWRICESTKTVFSLYRIYFDLSSTENYMKRMKIQVTEEIGWSSGRYTTLGNLEIPKTIGREGLLSILIIANMSLGDSTFISLQTLETCVNALIVFLFNYTYKQ